MRTNRTMMYWRALALASFLIAHGTRVRAQTWERKYADQLVLSSAGTDETKKETLVAPTLGGSTTITLPGASVTFPASNAVGNLQNDGAGNLSWTSLSSGITQVTNVNDSTTTSTSVTQVGLRDFDVVPGAGAYLVFFNAYAENSSSNVRNEVSIFANGSQITASVRAVQPPSAKYYPISTMAYVSGLASGQHINIEWLTSGGTMKLHQRTMILMKLQ